MLILLSLAFLLLSTLVMIAIRFWRPRFAFFWLTAAGSALIAWLLVLFIQPDLPVTWIISSWGPEDLFPQSPALLADPFTWPVAMAFVTLHLAALLTGMTISTVPGEFNFEWKNWTGGAAIAGLSLAVIFSANLLTLLLSWVLLDLVEFVIYLSRAQNSHESERVVIHYAIRSAGIGLALLAGIAAVNEGSSLAFGELSQTTSTLLLLSAAVRLGLFPNLHVLPSNLPAHPGYAAFLRLATTAAHLPLLVFAARSGALPETRSILFMWAGLTALLSAFSWYTLRDRQAARHDWIIGVASLVFASAVVGQPEATLTWGLAMLLPGGIILLSTLQNRWGKPLLLILAISLCALPYTPAWTGVMLYAGSFHLGWLLFLPAQALLLAGALRHLLRKQNIPTTQERWVWFVYTWGLLLLILINFYLAWRLFLDAAAAGEKTPSLWQTWPAAASLLLMLGGWMARPRIPEKWKNMAGRLETGYSFTWIIKPFWSFYHLQRRGFLFISSALESQPGILWTLLILVLIVSLVSQTWAGG